MGPMMKNLLLVGALPDVLEARRVILERAGYVVRTLDAGASVRRAADEMGASLIVIDTSAGKPDAREVLAELSSARAPSSTPVLIVGGADALRGFEGPGEAIERPAEKRVLLDRARSLLERAEGAPQNWSRRSRAVD